MAFENAQVEGQQLPGQTGGQAGGPSGTPGSGTAGWSMPDEYRGKSVEDVARMHHELSNKLGEQGSELEQLRKYAREASSFLKSWDPILAQVDYSPERLARYLEHAASAAQAQGRPQQAAQLSQQAQVAQSFADAMSPHEQQRWIESHVSSQVHPLANAVEQRLNQVTQQWLNHLNEYGNLAMTAIEQWDRTRELGDGRPSLNEILQDAVRATQERQNPIVSAVQARLQPKLREAEMAKIRAEERARLEQEYANKGLTTFVGAGSAPSRAMRPHGQAPAHAPVMPQGMPLPPGVSRRAPEAAQLAAARERAIHKIAQIPAE